ncbi:aryl-alcohol-oxidase from pleurotus Eryingii [Lactarius indigo]|nr:aryl-alcohol-oxidase from pleurotus Eryingii [Lactarius indigo]
MVSAMRLSVAFTLLFIKSVIAAIYTDPSTLPNASYTYIIVGAGPGGSVLANRLSANPNNRVLLIEAGPRLAWVGGPLRILVDALSVGPLRSYSPDFMVWTRGPASDFDRMAYVTGDPGWSYDALRSTLIGVETLVPPPDDHITTGEVDASIHGSNGPVNISVKDIAAIDSRIFNTTSLLAEFPFNEDMNSGNPLGIGWTQFSIGSGQRSSASVSYLKPALSRSNLDILISTQVTKVIQTGTQGGLPIFRGVQFAQSASGPLFSRNATKEVILAAGAINTPQLLMLSGIGDSAQLSQFNIQTIVNLPDVGKNMQDHAILLNAFSVNSNLTDDDISRNYDAIPKRFSTVGTNSRCIGWLRLPKNSTIFKKQRDPSSGPQAPHYEFIFINGFFSIVDPPPTTGHFMTIASNVITPTSRGSITLTSANPFDVPNIDPALLNSDFDIFTIREGTKAALRFAAAPAWSDYVIGPFGALAEAKTDAEIDAYARSHSASVFHPSSTAFMSRKGSSNGVVNPDLSVKKTIGLRIVDASVLPYVPAAHPQAVLYTIAERAAKLIRCEPRLGCHP